MPASEENVVSVEVYKRLNELGPDGRYKLMAKQRTEIILRAVEAHPHGILVFPSREGYLALIMGVDLSPESLKRRLKKWQKTPPWWNSEHQRANLRDANFRGAVLDGSNFQKADLMAADFSETRLYGANFRQAGLVLAQFPHAWLIEADLSEAYLGDTNFQQAVLEKANLQSATLGAANLQGANLKGADLRGARLTYRFGAPNLGADLKGANLQETNLERVDLTGCDLAGIYICGAHLERTLLQREQIGEKIGEEIDGDYSAAAQGYFVLRRNFEELGDHQSAQWAYLRQRRVMKKWYAAQAVELFQSKRFGSSLRMFTMGLGDLIVELICDYGESIWRVLASLLVLIFMIGPLMVSISGGLFWTGSNLQRYFALSNDWQRLLYGYFEMLLYVFGTITASTPPDLQPANELVQFVSNLIALIGVFLVGLLGFVAGNRIRSG